MFEHDSSIISKIWAMCHPLRDVGVTYGDYLEQLTYLLFLKMSDEYAKPPYKRDSGIPAGYGWADYVRPVRRRIGGAVQGDAGQTWQVQWHSWRNFSGRDQ